MPASSMATAFHVLDATYTDPVSQHILEGQATSASGYCLSTSSDAGEGAEAENWSQPMKPQISRILCDIERRTR